jgi:hypothetical protein
MRLYAAEATLILGKLRKDGSRRVLAVRLRDWSGVAAALRTHEVPVQTATDGGLLVHLPSRYQQVFFFLEEAFPGEPSPIHRISRRKRSRRKARSHHQGNGDTT